jgi:integrase
MPRPHKIWKRKGTNWYYITINGDQKRLSTDKGEAERMMHELLSKEEPEEKVPVARVPLKQLINLFLHHAKQTKEEGTFVVQTIYLQSFLDHVGKNRKVSDLKTHMGEAWLAAHPEWNQSTRCTAVSIVKACLNWGVNQDYILLNPLRKLKRGDFLRRERILTPDERQRIRDTLPENARDFVFTLEQSGMRPFSEVARITAAMVNFKDGIITFEKHKNSKKGKRRVVYLTPVLLDLLRRLALNYPEGFLFRTRTGRHWTRETMRHWSRKLEKRLKIPRLSPYAWRHTAITDALARGISASVCADLYGTSVRTIERYYQHLDQHKDLLREAARKAVGV